jgi:hypothetical protein
MCTQLVLEVPYKRPKKKEIPSSFHEFRSEEVHSEKHPKKNKKLMFECYNLLDPME